MIAGVRSEIDHQKVGGFMQRLMADMSGAVASALCFLGDRLGLFGALAGLGPATAGELAARTGTDPRYALEWLRAMASAGYVEHDPVSDRFTLPPEHAVALAWEQAPMFLGGAYQQLAGLLGPLDQLTGVFQKGGGLPEEAYDGHLREGMDRVSAGWFDHLLVQAWVPAIPAAAAALEAGARVADLGCGTGRALVNLARAFPRSRFVGYDIAAPALERARARAEAAGVDDRVRFERRDVAAGLPERYDLVTAFDVLHDIARPRAVCEAVRRALTARGTWLLVEINCAERPEANAGPVATILYGTSVLFCLPTSLANGAEGLGTLGLPETRIRELCQEAGFGRVRRLPIETPFNAVYEVAP
jgi:2-polyprenyl-3-methyl-5-hydroxy-6-metoxy-1,4-benzoquinol methylase